MIKNIADVVRNYSPSEIDAPVKKRVLPSNAALIINKLFSDLKAIFPAWRSAFPSENFEENAKREWTKAFIEGGIRNTQQIELGLKKARKWGEPWFPSVGQFCDWCKPNLEDYGLIPVEQALRACIDGRSKKHPAIYLAAQATGSWALKSMTHRELLPLFTRNYEIACNRVMSGEDLSQVIPKALPEKIYVVTEQKQRVKNASNLRQLLKTKMA